MANDEFSIRLKGAMGLTSCFKNPISKSKVSTIEDTIKAADKLRENGIAVTVLSPVFFAYWSAKASRYYPPNFQPTYMA